MTAPLPQTPAAALSRCWLAAGCPQVALNYAEVPQAPALLPSSFAINTAAQSAIAMAALAAALLRRTRGQAWQRVRIPAAAALRECTSTFSLNGVAPTTWAPLSGLYPTADGRVRIHANFDHHRDGVLDLLDLARAAQVTRDQVRVALRSWRAEDFEAQAAARGLVVAAARSSTDWAQHPHHRERGDRGALRIEREGDAAPQPLTPLRAAQRPLAGVRVLELTRILAGPVCGRTLAAYGAEVLLINAPHLPNIEHVIDTSRGKRSAHLDLRTSGGQETLHRLLAQTDVLLTSYRPGALDDLGLSPAALRDRYPQLIQADLSAYGQEGPWAGRRGFDSLVQTATGLNFDEAEAFGSAEPRALPVQLLDYASGFLLAAGIILALGRRGEEGGGWHVNTTLLDTAYWLRGLGRDPSGTQASGLTTASFLKRYPCRAGVLHAMPHGAHFEHTPWRFARPATLPGTDPPAWIPQT